MAVGRTDGVVGVFTGECCCKSLQQAQEQEHEQGQEQVC